MVTTIWHEIHLAAVRNTSIYKGAVDGPNGLHVLLTCNLLPLMWRTERLRVVRWVIVCQAGMVLVVALAGWLISPLSGKSAFLGGLTCWLPTCWFALRAFQYSGARSAAKIAQSFYAGASGKMVLTMVSFGCVFALVKPIEPLAVFAGFAGVVIVNWVVPLKVAQLDSKRKRIKN